MCMLIRRFHFKEIAKETKGQICKDAGILIFKAALFTVTKSWKHPKCPLIKDINFPMVLIKQLEKILRFCPVVGRKLRRKRTN